MANKDQPIGEWSVGWLRRVLLYTRSNLSPVVVVPPFKEWDGRMCAEEGRNKYVFPSPIRCVVRAACIYVLHTPNRIAGGSGGMDEAMQLGFAFLLSFFSLPSTTTVISSSHFYSSCCCCCFSMVGWRRMRKIYALFVSLTSIERKKPSPSTYTILPAQQQSQTVPLVAHDWLRMNFAARRLLLNKNMYIKCNIYYRCCSSSLY